MLEVHQIVFVLASLIEIIKINKSKKKQYVRTFQMAQYTGS